MKFRYTILYVSDVAKTLDFYVRAFGFKIQFLLESGEYGQLDTGETFLSFSALELMESLGKSPGVPDQNAPVFELAFETDDVEGALKKALDAGATLKQEAREEPWGQTTAYVVDPNGFLVELCSPVQGQ